MRLVLLASVALGVSSCSSAGSPASAPNDSGVSATDGAGDTWASWAQGFFSKYCVECHAASDPTGRDFTMQSVVVQNKVAIRCGVCNAQDPSWGCAARPRALQFPISDATGSNPKPTAAERDRVVAWITAGCP